LKNGPCHDEINVYRFSAIAERPGWFLGAGSKVVDGKEISMGALEWNYDAERHTLKSENSGGTFRLIVDGSKMEGNLVLPNILGTDASISEGKIDFGAARMVRTHRIFPACRPCRQTFSARTLSVSKDVAQGLKPRSLSGFYGPTKVVP
jgi:hypothetical protein